MSFTTVSSTGTVTTEFRSCAALLEWLFEADLKMCYMITAASINANIWDIFVLFLILYGFMEFKTRRGKPIIMLNCRNMRVNKFFSNVVSSAFLSFSAHIVHILPFIMS